ncbi:uncharacterized protein LOC114716449 [Neltuma alba]|uniref:uncharacterized protein LOC114716449 n=1 Tax=Neltuma alba TaxID=207710 RepID=UPI0010A2BF0F|nr:uncharacterized protein LOC114716449 [Prosopis alba]
MEPSPDENGSTCKRRRRKRPSPSTKSPSIRRTSTDNADVDYRDIHFSFVSSDNEYSESRESITDIMGENEVPNRIAAVSKHQRDSTIDPALAYEIKLMLDEVNPYVKQYHHVASIINRDNYATLKLCLISSRYHDGRIYNMPSTSEVAALIVSDIDNSYNVRDIIVEYQSGIPKRINELHACYLPLQYPSLFPYGEDGYRDDIEHREETLSATKKKKRLSMREFFSYRLMTRELELSVLLHATRLLQQFIVDGYTMIESQRLLWIRTHQKELRVELYRGLTDAVLRGKTDASAIRKRIILTSSFTGGARYMIQNYQDAMALCRWAGYPDIFLTFTCNPAWPEIKRFCQKQSLQPSDRPNILCRVFKMKLHSLLKTIKEKRIFGSVRAEVYIVEFQKRGLPHAHILLFLEPEDKINNTERIDEVISAEIPDKESSPILYDLVQTYMFHGLCGANNPKSPCMKDKKCTKYFPKRDSLNKLPWMMKMFQAHINVEKCNQSTSIKYLFKYISKGNDRVVAGIFDNSRNHDATGFIDEIQQYYSCRYISACESAWRIFGFQIHHRYPAVERLSFHLPNQQFIIYSNSDDVTDLLDKPRVAELQFLAWMKFNSRGGLAATLTYAEFPNHFVYQKNKRQWKERKKGFAVGRINHVSASVGELYYLRILLTKVKGPSSFEDIRTVDGVIHPTFRAACLALGLLDDDAEYISGI